jgi:hypothetical protein
MFNRMYEYSANQDYEERIRKTAQENYATKVERVNQVKFSTLTLLGEGLVHLGFHLQNRPHKSMDDVWAPR